MTDTLPDSRRGVGYRARRGLWRELPAHSRPRPERRELHAYLRPSNRLTARRDDRAQGRDLDQGIEDDPAQDLAVHSGPRVDSGGPRQEAGLPTSGKTTWTIRNGLVDREIGVRTHGTRGINPSRGLPGVGAAWRADLPVGARLRHRRSQAAGELWAGGLRHSTEVSRTDRRLRVQPRPGRELTNRPRRALLTDHGRPGPLTATTTAGDDRVPRPRIEGLRRRAKELNEARASSGVTAAVRAPIGSAASRGGGGGDDAASLREFGCHVLLIDLGASSNLARYDGVRTAACRQRRNPGRVQQTARDGSARASAASGRHVRLSAAIRSVLGQAQRCGVDRGRSRPREPFDVWSSDVADGRVPLGEGRNNRWPCTIGRARSRRTQGALPGLSIPCGSARAAGRRS